MSTRSHHQVLLEFNQIALSIFSKAVAWWECDLNTNFAIDAVNLHPAYDYDVSTGGAGGPVFFHQPTLRSAGTFSTRFDSGAPAQYSPFGHFITEISGAMDHSVTTWYKPNNTSGAYILTQSGIFAYGIGANSNQQLGFYIDSGKPSAVWQYGSGSAAEVIDSTLTVVAGTTYFLGYSKNTVAKTVTHYTNGAVQNTAAYVNEPTGGSQQWLSLGQMAFTTALAAQGAIQGVACFRPALTAAEHAYIYNSGAGRSWAEIKTAAGH